MSFFKKAFKSIKSVTHNKMFQAGLGGLAVVFPVVGVPLVAGVALANKVTDGVASADAKIREQAKMVIQQTQALAKTGDVGAKRAVALMKITHAAKTNPNPAVRKAALSKLGRLAMVDKLRQAKAKQVVGQFQLTRGGRIQHKKTRRNLAANFR